MTDESQDIRCEHYYFNALKITCTYLKTPKIGINPFTILYRQYFTIYSNYHSLHQYINYLPYYCVRTYPQRMVLERALLPKVVV